MSSETIDKREVRRAFSNAADTYDAAAVLQHEVCRRMAERLDYIKHRPQMLLDAGSGTGNALPLLRERYGDAHIVAFDISLAMLVRGRTRMPWWRALPGLRSPLSQVCGDIERLPFATASVDMVWSNLALQWVNDLAGTFKEMHRVLKPGGLLMFSTFGPDTLKELRAAYSGSGYTHVNRFIDMHDIGDMLTGARYADPVIDMEPFTLTYDTVRHLMQDLKAIGAHNVTGGRPRALTGKGLLRAVTANYEPLRREGKLPATFEVVYGHAWKPMPRVGPTGRPVIDIAVKGS
ncbi:MAG: malonyl-ACP O-methyltransferase BioC [Rhodospirillaceae bacterium]